MMYDPETLKTIIILDTSKVIEIRLDIAKTYPHATKQEAAQHFAKAIQKVIDEALSELDLSLQTSLRNALIKDALLKESFTISGYDLLKLATSLTDTACIEGITHWMNTMQHTTLSSNDVLNLARAASTMHGSPRTEQTDSANKLAPTQLVSQSSKSEQFTDTIRSNIATLLQNSTNSVSHTLTRPILGAAIICLGGGILFLANETHSFSKQPSVQTITGTFGPFQIPGFAITQSDYLQTHLQYKDIDEPALLIWLQKRQSLLSEEPYFSTIISAAHAYNINPLLMFAITGQEQGFVPKTHAKAHTIANNPFNVFGSWQDFNTSITDTATIAARTIINLSKGCPAGMDPIKWLNQRYAEDPNWHLGVTYFFNELERIAGSSTSASHTN